MKGLDAVILVIQLRLLLRDFHIGACSKVNNRLHTVLLEDRLHRIAITDIHFMKMDTIGELQRFFMPFTQIINRDNLLIGVSFQVAFDEMAADITSAASYKLHREKTFLLVGESRGVNLQRCRQLS